LWLTIGNSSRTGTPVLLPAAGAFVAVPLAANAPSSPAGRCAGSATRCALLDAYGPSLKRERPPCCARLARALNRRARRGSGGLADFVGGEGVLDVGQDALLRGPRQLADALENLPGLAGRAGAVLGALCLPSNSSVVVPSTSASLGEIIRTQGRGASFHPA